MKPSALVGLGLGLAVLAFFLKRMNRMNIDQAGISFIKAREGWRDSVYLDAAGLQTIGYGHLIKAGESFDTITEYQGELLLKQDVKFAVDAVNNLVDVDLSQNQFNALVSFVYNIGRGAFADSTLLELLNAGDYNGAFNQFKYWKHAGGRESSGLVARRKLEAGLFLA